MARQRRDLAVEQLPVDEKPKAGVYVGLLFVSTGALVTGIIFLVMVLNRYGWALSSQ
ncbi:MAG: hypothetical protein KY476_21855 [Planctomycetes bacterium]|nr:hypothetical protein [Planctomycetota bacterium]